MAGGDELLPPSSHRLPTVSASHALHNLTARGARTVSTGISQLDKVLSAPSLPGHDAAGGYMRGKVTEVFGPSGVGKTSFGIQAAVSALREGHRVVWVDAACAPLLRERFDGVLSAEQKEPLCEPGADPIAPSETPRDELRSRLHYFAAPTLAHLLALFVHSPASFPPQNTSLVVLESLATLVDNAYPRNPDDRTTRVKTEQSRWAAGRRFAIINDLISTFTRFAATHDIALIVTSQTITRIRGASRAVLVPAMSGVEWEHGVSTRLVLFRDWIRSEGTNDKSEAARLCRARFVGLTKANGIALAEEGGVGNVVAFTIEHSGLHDLNICADKITASAVPCTHARPPKRPAAEMDEDAGEEPNSDELYGWIEDDEVAAEGVVINDTPIIDNPDTTGPRLEVVTDRGTQPESRTDHNDMILEAWVNHSRRLPVIEVAQIRQAAAVPLRCLSNDLQLSHGVRPNLTARPMIQGTHGPWDRSSLSSRVGSLRPRIDLPDCDPTATDFHRRLHKSTRYQP